MRDVRDVRGRGRERLGVGECDLHLSLRMFGTGNCSATIVTFKTSKIERDKTRNVAKFTY